MTQAEVLGFDKGTHQLAKVQDELGGVYVFKLPRNKIADYKHIMSEGELLAYRLKDSKEFRKAYTDEKIKIPGMNLLNRITPTENLAAFVARIEKIMKPEATEILKGGIKGAEKLAKLDVKSNGEKKDATPAADAAKPNGKKNGKKDATPAAEPTETVYKFKDTPLKKEGQYYYLYSERNCVHCGEVIPLKAQVPVKNGVVGNPATAHPINKDATRTMRGSSNLVHNKCRPVWEAVQRGDKGLQPDLEQHKEPKGVDIDVEHIRSLLTDEIKTNDYKVAYLTGYFDRLN